MGLLIGYVNATARNVVLQKLQLTSEIREKLEDADKRLGKLNLIVKSECPYLLERMGSPEPALRLNNPRWTAKLLGDAFTDCRFILGKSRFMSLELSHYCKAAQARAQGTQ